MSGTAARFAPARQLMGACLLGIYEAGVRGFDVDGQRTIARLGGGVCAVSGDVGVGVVRVMACGRLEKKAGGWVPHGRERRERRTGLGCSWASELARADGKGWAGSAGLASLFFVLFLLLISFIF